MVTYNEAIVKAKKAVKTPEVTPYDNIKEGDLNKSAQSFVAPLPGAEAGKVETTSAAATPKAFDAATYDPTKIGTKAATAVDKIAAAQGTVSPQSLSEAAQGTLSEGATAKTNTVDPASIQKVDENPELNVQENELVNAATMGGDYGGSQAAQTGFQSQAQGETRGTGQDELVDSDKILGDEEAPKAIAATMDTLNAASRMLAQEGTLSPQALAEAQQGAVTAKSTVQGQLEDLMAQFDNGTPAWAAGAIRKANAAMAQRGLGASSMAGAAIVQAAMESGTAIAATDAQVFERMNMKNLDNRQQVALTNAAAAQNIEMQNLTNKQQAALQNSTRAYQLQSQNLSNEQAVVLANAQLKSSLQGKTLDIKTQTSLVNASRVAENRNINLTNKQQASLQRSSENLQVDMSNLSNRQQTALANAQIQAALQGKELDNRQQAAVLNAERFAEAANIEFTAEQNAALHNSELMKTVGLANLSAEQATTLQNAATVASMDMTNLNNRQQSAVENAKAFLAMDMKNLDNNQQKAVFRMETVVQSMLSDQAAENSAKNFNAASENQVNQFFANLKGDIAKFNTAQKNAMAQFNAGEEGATSRFNEQMESNRRSFNAANNLLIEQANTKWRQDIAKDEFAATHDANMEAAKTLNGMTGSALNDYWQRERDIMAFSFQSGENAASRGLQLLMGDKNLESVEKQLDAEADAANKEALGRFAYAAFMGGDGGLFG